MIKKFPDNVGSHLDKGRMVTNGIDLCTIDDLPREPVYLFSKGSLRSFSKDGAISEPEFDLEPHWRVRFVLKPLVPVGDSLWSQTILWPPRTDIGEMLEDRTPAYWTSAQGLTINKMVPQTD